MSLKKNLKASKPSSQSKCLVCSKYHQYLTPTEGDVSILAKDFIAVHEGSGAFLMNVRKIKTTARSADRCEHVASPRLYEKGTDIGMLHDEESRIPSQPSPHGVTLSPSRSAPPFPLTSRSDQTAADLTPSMTTLPLNKPQP